MSTKSHALAIDDLPQVRAVKPSLPSSRETGKLVKASFFLHPETSKRLTDLCTKHNFSQQAALEMALDTYFRALGDEGIIDVEIRRRKEEEKNKK